MRVTTMTYVTYIRSDLRLVYLLNAVFDAGFDLAGLYVAIDMGFLCSERYDEDWDVDLSQKSCGDDIDCSNIKNLSIWTQTHLL